MIKLVVFDLDNVIIDGEGIDEIGKLINIEDQIAAITEQAMQGDIDFETSIKKRVGLLKGVATDDIKTLANEMPLMKGAEEAISSLKENGFDVAIISGSFDIIADTIKEKLNVDNVFTNSLVEENGILTGEVTGPLVSGSKLDVLSDFIDKAGYSLDECVAVGDGANDISMIESAKYGIAFNAKPALKENADLCWNLAFFNFNASLLANYSKFLNLSFYSSNVSPCLEVLFNEVCPKVLEFILLLFI